MRYTNPRTHSLHDQLHLLDVPDRVLFKLAATVHQCLNGRAPLYLSEHCIQVSSADTRRHLRSANRHLLVIPRFRLNTYGRRAFSLAITRRPETLSRILSGIQRAAQAVLRVYLKRTCSRVTSASSALRSSNDYALHKSTHSLTHSLTHNHGRQHSTPGRYRKHQHQRYTYTQNTDLGCLIRSGE